MKLATTFKTETLLAFVAVAKQQSFTGAAQIRNQTPMAMSKQIQNLEAQLKEPLFERSTRKVKLTQFGNEFLIQTNSILSQHEQLTNWLESRKGSISGKLKVVAQAPEIFQYTIFPWLAEFHQCYPDIELEFDIHDKAIDINQQCFDIYWGVSQYLGERHPGLKSRFLWESKYGIFASPSYLKRFGTPLTPADLTKHRVIGYLHNQPDNALVVNKEANQTPEQVNVELLAAPIKTVSGQIDLAVQGLGLINAADDHWGIKEHIENNRLVAVLPEYWWTSAQAFLYYQNVKSTQPKIRAFIDFFLTKQKLW